MEEIALEELNLSVRSFNCLKRAGLNTLADIINKLNDEGIDGFLKVRNLREESIEEILKKTIEKGYNAISVLQHYIATTSFDDNDIKHTWKLMKDRLCEEFPIAARDASGTLLYYLEAMIPALARRMRTNRAQPINTVEQLLEQFDDEEQLLLSDIMKWRLLRILDKNGYRFRNCSREQWADINDYIDVKRARQSSIEILELPDNIVETLITVGITVSKLIEEKHDFLFTYFNNGEVALILTALDDAGFRMKDASRKEYEDIADFIVGHVAVPIEEIGLSLRTINNLVEHDITTVGALIKYNRRQLLEQKIVGVTAISEIVKKLHKRHFHLTGDCFYSCSKCGEKFAAPDDVEIKHYCDDCIDRLKRIKKIQDFQVTIDGPDYGSYTDGSRGFTIFATLHNKSKKMISVTLREFMIFSQNRQWAASNYLTGYIFTTDHIMPLSSKTVAKIWSGSSWSDRKLEDGDYVTISFTIKEKVYSYKFVMRENKLEIDDYHTL